MTASLQEVQQQADAILALLGVRLQAGQVVLHFSEGRVQKVETNSVHRLQSRQPQKGLDSAEE